MSVPKFKSRNEFSSEKAFASLIFAVLIDVYRSGAMDELNVRPATEFQAVVTCFTASNSETTGNKVKFRCHAVAGCRRSKSGRIVPWKYHLAKAVENSEPSYYSVKLASLLFRQCWLGFTFRSRACSLPDNKQHPHNLTQIREIVSASRTLAAGKSYDFVRPPMHKRNTGCGWRARRRRKPVLLK